MEKGKRVIRSCIAARTNNKSTRLDAHCYVICWQNNIIIACNKLVAVFLLSVRPCSSRCLLSLVLYNVLHAFNSNNTDKVFLPSFIDILHYISSKNLGNDTQYLRFSFSQQYQLPLFDKLGLVDELENYLGPVSSPDET